MGWDTGFLDECKADPARRMNRADLDEVAPDNPVYLVDFTQHRLVANSLALKLAGITRDTTTEPGSEVVKDPATGEPTGVLVELPAQGILMRAVPLWTREEKRAAILADDAAHERPRHHQRHRRGSRARAGSATRAGCWARSASASTTTCTTKTP